MERSSTIPRTWTARTRARAFFRWAASLNSNSGICAHSGRPCDAYPPMSSRTSILSHRVVKLAVLETAAPARLRPMATYSYRIVNVFTQGDDPFSGNPLCVFESAESLDTPRMQALARQFNLSETTFILPSTRANARVRIFTPSYEMPFAGHPTLGTAHVCRALGLAGDTLTLEMQAGLIPVHATQRRWTLQANAPSWREVREPRAMPA